MGIRRYQSSVIPGPAGKIPGLQAGFPAQPVLVMDPAGTEELCQPNRLSAAGNHFRSIPSRRLAESDTGSYRADEYRRWTVIICPATPHKSDRLPPAGKADRFSEHPE